MQFVLTGECLVLRRRRQGDNDALARATANGDIFEGAPAAVAADPKVREAYLGSYAQERR